MLKKLAVLLGLLILSQMAQAEIRIGVVNIPLLMANAPQAADAKKRLEKEFSPKD
ncbi:secreted protein, partial [methanotrophic bacterial endosymbiont of Bathymodiolus sp.]